MSREPRLTLAYLEHAPAAAARVLEQLELGDAVAFLDSAPARLSAPVINAMIPWHGARCVEALSPARAALIVRQLSFNDSASLIRLTRHADRARVFDELPALLARRLTSALRYPVHLVGAWMDPEALVLRRDNRVDDALRLLKAGQTASHVFLESDEDGRFAGAISVQTVLRSHRGAPLADLPVLRVEPLSNRDYLTSVRLDERWDEFLHLPVVGRRGTLLGVLSRTALRKASREHAESPHAQDPSLLRHLLTALLVACSGLVRVSIQPMGALSTGSAGAVEHER